MSIPGIISPNTPETLHRGPEADVWIGVKTDRQYKIYNGILNAQNTPGFTSANQAQLKAQSDKEVAEAIAKAESETKASQQRNLDNQPVIDFSETKEVKIPENPQASMEDEARALLAKIHMPTAAAEREMFLQDADKVTLNA